jgi:hypothetical protein
MRNATTYILAAWIAVAACASSAGSLRGLVLCFSSQGHVAVEAEHVSPDCSSQCDPSSPVDAAGEFGTDPDEHCCFDLSLSHIEMRPERGRASFTDLGTGWESISTGFPGCASALTAAIDNPPAVWSRAAAPRAWSARQRALRTVILRI